jgi:predicted transposase YbfD/YdcC
MTQSFTINQYFRKLKDPRVTGRTKHLLIDIITITICAVICNCNDWQQIETFARCRHDWFKKFLRLPHGTPSHDTFERVFDQINPVAFQACFRDWMTALHNALGLSPIAIDGKTLRGSGVDGQKPLHLVSAWATANCLSLGQVAVEEKSNEITAIPKLLELLDVHGALVTIDAMGCQKKIAAKIVDGGGDYLLTAKDNQPSLVNDIKTCFANAAEKDFEGVNHDSYTTQETGHGRKETRHYQIITDPEEMPSRADWKDLNVIGTCYTETEHEGKVSSETRYFIGSRKAKAKVYGNALRGHWGIENKLHWQLDVGFAEDCSRVSKRHGAENLALVRRLALSLLLQHSGKGSIPCKRLEATLNPDFLQEILVGDENSGKI